MNIATPAPNDAATVESVSALVPWMQQRAAQLDDAAAFPTEELAALREAGVLALPLPIDQDLSEHDVRAVAESLANVLVQIGRGNLAVGRVVEAHINARRSPVTVPPGSAPVPAKMSGAAIYLPSGSRTRPRTGCACQATVTGSASTAARCFVLQPGMRRELW